jgi:hypothetical protein
MPGVRGCEAAARESTAHPAARACETIPVMSEDDDLRINTLHRFAKHSPRLILQEYSHCEVPAGCGGVVLRWFDPAQGVPVSIRLVALNATGESWLDGEPLPSTRATLVAGSHVIACHLRRRDPRPVLYTLGALPDSDDDRDLVRAGAPRWRATGRPAPGWQAPSFDDARWAAPEIADPDVISALDSGNRYALDLAARRGQPILTFDAAELWLRVTFAVAEAP